MITLRAMLVALVEKRAVEKRANPRQLRRKSILGAVPSGHKAGYNRGLWRAKLPREPRPVVSHIFRKPFKSQDRAVITSALGRLSSGQNLSLDEMTDVIDHVMSGEIPANEIALFLTALRAKGETVDEIAGAALAMRRHMTPIRTTRTNLVDTCGTGGIGSELFNISTTAAIVTAAAGVPVAKHGNRSMTSKSGSADVLAALGIQVDAEVPVVERCLDELGICFCFAPRLHPAMKHVAPVRKQLGIPTIFNLLGPLCNPAGASRQLMGVGRRELHATMAAVLARLGTERAVVVHGTDGLGEVSLAAATDVIEVVGNQMCELSWKAADFGLTPAGLESLRVTGPEESAAIVRRVLAGEGGPPRDMVVLNAAAALWTAETRLEAGATLHECAARAAAAIDSGAASDLLERWRVLSHAG
jgi:anthranilate phosphoribosyltransferase